VAVGPETTYPLPAARSWLEILGEWLVRLRHLRVPLLDEIRRYASHHDDNTIKKLARSPVAADKPLATSNTITKGLRKLVRNRSQLGAYSVAAPFGRQVGEPLSSRHSQSSHNVEHNASARTKENAEVAPISRN
jgi:hypothetical protein